MSISDVYKLIWQDTIVVEGKFSDCVDYIHEHHNYSFNRAIKNERYKFFKNGERVSHVFANDVIQQILNSGDDDNG